MADKDIVKCRFANCIHKSRDMHISEAVLEGKNSYYHPDCALIKNQVAEIIQLFVDYMNPNPVYTQLTQTIYKIVFDKRYGSDYLLFGMKYFIAHGRKLNYPGGLWYLVNDLYVKKAYENELVRRQKETFEITSENSVPETPFTYIAPRQKSIADILG